MRSVGGKLVGAVIAMGLLVSCANTSYVNKADSDDTFTNPFSKVVYQVHDAYRNDPPGCVAILPFETPEEGQSNAEDISLDQTETVRRVLYAHLSPQGKRDVEIPRVDFLTGQMSTAELKDYSAVGESLGCDALVVGEVTEYGSAFFGIYSRVAVGADLRMIRAADGNLLWEGEHVAASHGGDVPLSPIGLAMGIVRAARNLNEEQVSRVIDDLARRLVSTIPDNRVAVLEEPLSPIQVAVRKRPADAKTAQEFLSALNEAPLDDRQSLVIQALEAGRFEDEGMRKLHETLIGLAPEDPESHARYARYLVDHGDYRGALGYVDRSLSLNSRAPEMQFLKARTLIKLEDLKGADGAIVEAIALDNDNAQYFNALGYVNSLRESHERALAAYRMALERDPANGFAYYNIGVTLLNQGDVKNAADAFYGAGLAYLKTGDYGQAEKTILDLKGLASEGVELAKEVQALEKAMKRLMKKEGTNA